MAVRIALGHVKVGLNEFDMVATPVDIGLEGINIKGNIGIYIAVNKISNQLNCNIKLSGILLPQCDRCLEVFEKPFESQFELVYIVQSQYDGQGKAAYNDDYVRPYSPHMRFIDITKDMKDFVELAVPMRRVPDEKPDGSCSWCGKTKEYWNTFIVEKNEDAEDNENFEE